MSEDLIDKALRHELITTFNDPSYRPPPLPSVAFQLVDLTHRDDTRIQGVVRLLEQDPVLAGIVIRLVSSPVYAGRSPVTSLQQAVVRVGLNTLRSVVFEATLRRGIFDIPDYREIAEQVGRHSTTTAYIARLICEACRIDPEAGFLCGLLHDVGFSALLLCLSKAEESLRPDLSKLWLNIDGLHEQASKMVTRLWRLPLEIVDVVGNHHHPERCPSTDGTKLTAAVCLADALTARFGANIAGMQSAHGEFAPADKQSDESLITARKVLQLDDDQMERVFERATKIVPQILSI